MGVDLNRRLFGPCWSRSSAPPISSSRVARRTRDPVAAPVRARVAVVAAAAAAPARGAGTAGAATGTSTIAGGQPADAVEPPAAAAQPEATEPPVARAFPEATEPSEAVAHPEATAPRRARAQVPEATEVWSAPGPARVGAGEPGAPA